MKKKAVINKEETAESWCFVCKDGGVLRICDKGACPKSYHSSCLGKDDSFLGSDNYWACAWHTCFKCRRYAYLHCYTCTNAVCRRCLPNADFLRVKGHYGFCNTCLYLALLIEDGKDCDSDGEKVDFKDRETYEGLFMEYYVIVKEKEGFKLTDFHSAKDRVKTKKESNSDSEEIDEADQTSDDDDDDDDAEYVRKRRRKCNEKSYRRNKSGVRTPTKIRKNDFIDWGSRSLIEFLSSIGKDTSEKLSQRDVTSIVNNYIKENKLLHPTKRKMILCNSALKSLFRKSTLSTHRVHKLLEGHFAENYDESEEDELEYDSEDENEGIPGIHKTKRNWDLGRKSLEKELADNSLLGSRFASIIVQNVKLVYLKRSLILELLKEPKTFEEKVVGCFVRLKSDRRDCPSRNSYQLMKVTGVRRVSADQMEAILLISAVPEEISTSLLSDDDCSKEECEDLRERILAGQLERPTVVDLQQKANILHADLTKHRIRKELALLRNLIDRANEKGWRSTLFEYRQKQRTLQNPLEVSKLLENVPKVIPELDDVIPDYEYVVNYMSREKDSPKSIIRCNSSETNDGWQDHKASEENAGRCNISVPEREHLKSEDDNVTSRKAMKSCAELRNIELEIGSSHKASEEVVIDLLSDDENSNDGKETKNVHELPSMNDMWYLQTPDGQRNKYSLSVLKEWSETSACASKFKVWKEDQNEEDAVWLHEMLSAAFPKK